MSKESLHSAIASALNIASNNYSYAYEQDGSRIHKKHRSSNDTATTVSTTTLQKSRTSIYDLPFEILSKCLAFVGDKQYRFIALVSQIFLSAYLQLYNNERLAYVSETISSVSCLTLLIEDKKGLKDSLAHSILRQAAKSGSLDVLKWMQKEGYTERHLGKTNIIVLAARQGHLDVCKWLRSVGFQWSRVASLAAAAAENGHLDVLMWANANGFITWWDYVVCAKAAKNNHLDVLKWVISGGCRLSDGDYESHADVCSCPFQHFEVAILSSKEQSK